MEEDILAVNIQRRQMRSTRHRSCIYSLCKPDHDYLLANRVLLHGKVDIFYSAAYAPKQIEAHISNIDVDFLITFFGRVL